jgi:hypothetical protein
MILWLILVPPLLCLTLACIFGESHHARKNSQEDNDA